MVTTLLQILIPLAYTVTGFAAARYVWQGKRERPAVYGTDPVNCYYSYPGYSHSHSRMCYELISDRCGSNFDAMGYAVLALFFWPFLVVSVIGWQVIVWRTPQTTGEKILALRKAEAELETATARMRKAKEGMR